MSGLSREAVSDRNPPRVFVSYAHESGAHVEVVPGLWVLLRSLGVDAQLDLPAAERRQDWPVWMLREVREAEFVLVIASPAYCRRAEGLAAADEGRGVQFEAALIREELYRDRRAGLVKFLPVVLPGQSIDDIPALMGPTTATSYRLDEITQAGVERLLRALTKQPWEVEPPIGGIPVLPPRPTDSRGQEGIVVGRLAHELLLDVACEQRRVKCRIFLAGTLLGEHEAALPSGMDRVWEALSGLPASVEARLAATGERLRVALLDELSAGHVMELLDRSPLGTVVEVVIEADGAALALPYELLRLSDGRLLATVPGVRIRRRVRGVDRDAVAPLPGPLKILVAVGAPEETRTASAPLDVEAEMQAILDAIGGVEVTESAQVVILGSPGMDVVMVRPEVLG
ncbi:MAG: SEFIR domain-containing protein [Solirubrobacteraceae bacterium]